MAELEKDTSEISLRSYNYYLKQNVRNGSLGSLYVACQLHFEKVQPGSPFGQKFLLIKEKISPLLEGVNKLFVKYNTDKGEMGSLILGIFLEDFRDRCFVRGGNVAQISPKTKIYSLVEAILHHLRYWDEKLTKSGWRGRFWDSQMAFQNDLHKLVESLPPVKEETFLIKKRENSENEDGDGPAEHKGNDIASEEDAVPEAEMARDNAEVKDGSYDATKFRKITRTVEPLVREIEDMVREAVIAKRLAPQKPRPMRTTDENQRENHRENPRILQKSFKGPGQKMRYQKTDESPAGQKTNEDPDGWTKVKGRNDRVANNAK